MARGRKARENADRDIIHEMNTRFTRCESREAMARTRWVNDVKFCEGDSDNLYQWPDAVVTRLESEKRVMLTINQVRQFVLDILNDARQSRVGIKIRPTGGGASFESAQVYEGLVRHIEYISNAATAYQHGLKGAVQGGIGYWRVVTDYANDDSFDQEIFIRRIKDPLMVYLDPDINEVDGSDAMFGIIFSDMPREEFDKLNPKWADKGSVNLGAQSWIREDAVRTAEYFRRAEHSERLLAFEKPADPPAPGEDPAEPAEPEMAVAKESDLAPEIVDALLKLPTTKERRIKTHKVEWFKRVGDDIVERREWPGAYIPIVRCIGEETVIEGELDRKGHVRAVKDSQRMFNFNASGSVEFGALQSKIPYMAPADAIEGYEEYWNNANLENFGVLPYNHRDDEGEAIPPPQRQQPPTVAPVFLQGMKDASEQMRMASGQYQADLGMPSNERSGVAITARQRQGDNATFHYLDHQAIAVRFTGKIIIDLVPKVYDTERVFKIMGLDGTEKQIKVDPTAKKAMQKTDETRDAVSAIFNPSVGTYEVESDVGPAFQTQRQEAWNAGVQILSQNKELTSIIGDLVFRNADFPGAQEIAERIKRMVPSQALEDGPSPDLLAANKNVEALQGLVKELAAKLADKTAANRVNQEKVALSAYGEQTKRLNVLADALGADPEGLMLLVRQVLEEAQATSSEGLGPALMPDRQPTAEEMIKAATPEPPPAPPGAPGTEPGMAPAPPGGEGQMAAPNASPEDMAAGPAAAPGGAPV